MKGRERIYGRRPVEPSINVPLLRPRASRLELMTSTVMPEDMVLAAPKDLKLAEKMFNQAVDAVMQAQIALGEEPDRAKAEQTCQKLLTRFEDFALYQDEDGKSTLQYAS